MWLAGWCHQVCPPFFLYPHRFNESFILQIGVSIGVVGHVLGCGGTLVSQGSGAFIWGDSGEFISISISINVVL